MVANAATMPDSAVALLRDTPPVEVFNAALTRQPLTRYDLASALESGDYHRYDGTHLHVDTVIAYDGEGRNEAHRYVAEVMGPALVSHALDIAETG